MIYRLGFGVPHAQVRLHDQTYQLSVGAGWIAMMMVREGWSWPDEPPFESHMQKREIVYGIVLAAIACLMLLGGLIMLVRDYAT